MCGADATAVDTDVSSVGSSPRVRSRRHGLQRAALGLGIISACAEQTVSSRTRRYGRRDHLRVCGADTQTGMLTEDLLGSSPRVRSRRELFPLLGGSAGIISACAEQTCLSRCCRLGWWDHLRVCGADLNESARRSAVSGSSPRVRSRCRRPYRRPRPPGIISACAKQTPPRWRTLSVIWDHLRVCGADVHRAAPIPYDEGSSPRVRSRHYGRVAAGHAYGIISACAEQTS